MPKYDVAVVGAGLGGLAAAALLSSKKKKVLVTEGGGSLNNALGAFEKDGFVFSSAPTLSYGFERGGAIHELFASLGILHNASVLSPCYQVALPDRRITVYADVSETLEELRREFPGEIDTLAKFYRDLHKEAARSDKSRFFSFLAMHRAAAGFLRKYRFSRELMTFLDVQSLFFFQKPAMDLSFPSLLTLCDSPPLYFHGGFKKVADQLYGIILREGGEVRYRERSLRLASKSGRVIGIEGSQGVVEADAVLLNRAPTHNPTTLFVGLREEVVPVGMGQEVLFLPDYARPRDFIALSLSAKDDAAAAPQGMRTLCASFRSQHDFPADSQALIEHLGKLIPFLNDHVVFSENYPTADEGVVPPADMQFKPLRSDGRTSLLSRGSKKNVYVLSDVQEAPLQVISAVQRFVKLMT